jgi:competence protein ComFC
MIEIKNPVADWLFPRRCFTCGQDIYQQEFCISCLSLCHDCPNPDFLGSTNIAALFYFEFTMKKLLKAAKYRKNNLAIYLLFKLINQQLFNSNLIDSIKIFSPRAVTYIPSHWLNRIMRGVELPSLFAHSLGEKLKIPVINLFYRRSFLGRQALRARKSERRMLIKGDFGLRSNKTRYDKILIVDDIITTGATLSEAQRVLANVADNICAVAIAKTP